MPTSDQFMIDTQLACGVQLLTIVKIKPMLLLIRPILHNLRIIMIVSNEMARNVAPITVPAVAGINKGNSVTPNVISGIITKMSAGKDPNYKEISEIASYTYICYS